MKNKLKPEEQALFRQAMRDVKPLDQAKVKIRPESSTNGGATAGRPLSMPNVKPTKLKVSPDPLPAAPFSDHDYLDLADSEDRLEFARSGISARLQRALRRGQQRPQAVLDLHGKTVEEARFSLHQFLLVCQAEGSTQVLIIHGKGRGQSKPVLKNKLNHWLRQSERVLAFCSASPKDGGTGALYLRLKRG